MGVLAPSACNIKPVNRPPSKASFRMDVRSPRRPEETRIFQVPGKDSVGATATPGVV
jgi:hypothetical protein